MQSLGSTFTTTHTFLKHHYEQCTQIDARSLAVVRILLGLLLIADIILRSRNFTYLYTEHGAVTQAAAQSVTPDYALSVYYLTTNTTIIAALFVLTALIGLQLTIGYKTRIATILSFILVISLDHHNPFVLSYADILYQILLFWGMFLPLGERYSLDAHLKTCTPRTTISNIATTLVLLQIVTMYFVNGMLKYSSETTLWDTGTAAPLILERSDMNFFLADVFNAAPVTLLQYGGKLWFYLMFSGWLLLFLQRRQRTGLVLLFMISHATFALTVRIGAFPYVAITGLFLFLQTSFWNDLNTLTTKLTLSSTAFSPLRKKLSNNLPKQFLQSLPAPTPPGKYRRRGYAIVSTITAAIMLVMILTTILWGAGINDPVNSTPVEKLNEGTAIIAMDQPAWGVFAPDPAVDERYFVMPAQTTTGETLDVYSNTDIEYTPPETDRHTQYGTYRERFLMGVVISDTSREQNTEFLGSYLSYVCRTGNTSTQQELTHVNIYEITLEKQLVDGEATVTNTEITELHKHSCNDSPTQPINPPSNK